MEKVYVVYVEGKIFVIYISCKELIFENVWVCLEFGVVVLELLMDIVWGLLEGIGFLISKGGIIFNDILSKGLVLIIVRLLG